MNILEFTSLLGTMATRIDVESRRATTEACKMVQTQAKAVLGTYDYNWPSLKPETVARKSTGDSPLLETGELRDSIEYTVTQNRGASGRFASGWYGEVGSNNNKAVWHELGTPSIPPRSFLEETAKHLESELHEVLGSALKHALYLR